MWRHIVAEQGLLRVQAGRTVGFGWRSTVAGGDDVDGLIVEQECMGCRVLIH